MHFCLFMKGQSAYKVTNVRVLVNLKLWIFLIIKCIVGCKTNKDEDSPKGLDPMVESEEFFTIGQGSILVRALLVAMGTPWGSGGMCGCTQRYYIKWYRDVCTHKWIKSHPHVLQILSPKELDPMVESGDFFTVGQGSIPARALLGAMGAPWGSGRTCGCTQRYYIKWYRDPCTHSGSKPTPMSFKFFSPRGVGQSVTECVVKPLRVEKSPVW
jgi:hypothetical protein